MGVGTKLAMSELYCQNKPRENQFSLEPKKNHTSLYSHLPLRAEGKYAGV